jgi:hypothetical protein
MNPRDLLQAYYFTGTSWATTACRAMGCCQRAVYYIADGRRPLTRARLAKMAELMPRRVRAIETRRKAKITAADQEAALSLERLATAKLYIDAELERMRQARFKPKE